MARVMRHRNADSSIRPRINQPLSALSRTPALVSTAGRPSSKRTGQAKPRGLIRDGNRARVVTRLRRSLAKRCDSESVDLNDATREVIALSLSELQRSRVIPRTELADDLPPVRGDRVQLQQVILNLLRNASDAMSGVDDRPRQLVIRTARDEGDHVRVSVQDAGVG